MMVYGVWYGDGLFCVQSLLIAKKWQSVYGLSPEKAHRESPTVSDTTSDQQLIQQLHQEEALLTLFRLPSSIN
jgi:hypothetical protein